MAKKRVAKRSPRELSPKKGPKEERITSLLMPYILGAIAVFLVLCYFLGDGDTGFLGKYLKAFFTGTFSVGAYFLPVFLLIQAIFYRRDCKAGSQLYKFWFHFAALVFIGAFYGLVAGAEPTFSFSENYALGKTLEGGGVAGGFFLALFEKLVGKIGAGIFSGLGAIIFTSFLFGKTPAELIRGIILPLSDSMNARREERAELRAIDRAERAEREEAEREERRKAREEKRKEEKEQSTVVKNGKKKCEVQLETGEVISEKPREDALADDEVQIKLPLGDEKNDPTYDPTLAIDLKKKHRREKHPLEGEICDAEYEEAEPTLSEQLADIFAAADRNENEFSPAEEGSDHAIDEDENAVPWPEEEIVPLAETELSDSAAESDGEEEPAEEISSETEPLPKPEDFTPETEILSAEPVPEVEEKEYRFPPLSFLQAPPEAAAQNRTEQEQTAKKLVETLASFGVKTSIIGISKGPTITRYELQPQPGVRVRSILNLTDDISLALAASGVRIEAPIPGKEAVGIEVPNRNVETVYVRSLIDSEPFNNSKSKLNCCLGMDVAGKPIFCDLAKMPHILIAGATGMGKSVCLNSLIVSILYHARPEEVQLILIDPKKVEMAIYNRIPHLLVPVVSDPKKAAGALNWAVIEMEKRFIQMEEVGVRDIKNYNEITKNDPERPPMSQIVIMIDELADLMMTARDEVETSICRIAQKARAAGMHLVIGTQRPSVDVITGLIKANVPSRIAFTVASQVDSRTIIDIIGAEKLIGRGDMLYAPVGATKPIRVQGSFVSEKEIEAICDFIRSEREAEYDDAVSNLIEREASKCGEKKKGAFSAFGEEEGSGGQTLFADKDPLLEKAIEVAVTEQKVSTSLLQRKLSVGYARAAKLIDFMDEMHVVGPYAGAKPREVLWSSQYFVEYKMKSLEDHPIE